MKHNKAMQVFKTWSEINMKRYLKLRNEDNDIDYYNDHGYQTGLIHGFYEGQARAFELVNKILAG